jgi:Domain of unknown function (DUF4412)
VEVRFSDVKRFLFALLLGLDARADLILVQKVEESCPAQSGEMTLKVKGDLVRADISPEISTLTNTATGDTITLRHPQKLYMRINAQSTRELLRQMEKLHEEKRRQNFPEETPKLEATGKRETVSGVETKIFTAQVGSMKITYWIAQNYPDSEKILQVFNALQKTAIVKLGKGLAHPTLDFEFPGIPLKTEMVTPEGRKITTTILSIKEQSLDAIDFTVPPDYREIPEPSFGPAPVSHLP